MNEMIDMHSKYDNMHKKRMLYALICINNHIIACDNCMLAIISRPLWGGDNHGGGRQLICVKSRSLKAQAHIKTYTQLFKFGFQI